MGQNVSSPLNVNLDNLHNHLMRQAGADLDIATTTTLTYNQFVLYITELNRICATYKDQDGCFLVFAVKKGTDRSFFWKATVRVACVKFNTTTNEVESHRLLNIRQFLQIFRRISYECTDEAVSLSSSRCEAGAAAPGQECMMPPTVAASMLLSESSSHTNKEGSEINQEVSCQAEGGKKFSGGDDLLKKESSNTNLEECVICLERKPDVILPCCHAYCLPCIEQWWEYCENAFEDECLARNIFEQMNVVDRSCPVCRESLSNTEDTWVLPEIPDKSEVSDEIRKSLISYASCGNSTVQKTDGKTEPT